MVLEEVSVRKTKVLIVDNNTVMGEIIGNLLQSRQSYHVSNFQGNCEMELNQEIEHFQPDVVLLVKETNCPETDDQIRPILSEASRIRLLIMNLDDNLVNLYDKNQLTISHSSDIYQCFDVPLGP